MGSVDSVVDRDDDGEDPGEKRKDLVQCDGTGAMRLPLAEGVPYDGQNGNAGLNDGVDLH